MGSVFARLRGLLVGRNELTSARRLRSCRPVHLRLEWLEERINATVGITTSTIATGFLSQPYSQAIATSGGTAPITFSLATGNLPAGLSLNSSTGAITGTPTTSTISNLATFPYNAANPYSGLIADSNNNLYGTTYSGGTYGLGTVFELAAGNYTTPITLVNFSGAANGANPEGGLYIDTSGNIYGTTNSGGSSSVDGTVFELAAGTHALTTLVNFNFNNGANPQGALIADPSGNLYGTTTAGGSGSYGTVFELPVGNRTNPSTLTTFNGTNGYSPEGNLVFDSSGNLYGTTFGEQFPSGGVTNGTVFELAAGAHTSRSTLVTFTGTSGSYLGENPEGLVIDPSGNLYGTNYQGGTYGWGTVFELAANHTTFTTLTNFTDYGNGGNPRAGLIMDASGNLYGTTSIGSSSTTNLGTAFEVAASNHALTTLVNFTGSANGESPYGGLVFDSYGNLYGTTYGTLIPNANSPFTNAFGTVFELAAGTHALSTLDTFTGTANGTNNLSTSSAGLVADSSGDFFGTTQFGGADNDGTVFEIVAGSHTVTTLVSFTGTANGAQPVAGFYQDSSGDLFGTTEKGGTDNDGTLFEIVAGTHAFMTLFTFTGTANGEYPEGTLVADNNGDLFGTTYNGGTYNGGTVFEYAANHTFTTLVSFNTTSPNGYDPQAGLCLDTSTGNLFGTTLYGGSSYDGTVFEVAPVTHALTTLVNFNTTNGQNPEGGLVEDSNNNFYGTTAYGGQYYDGTVFELAANTYALTTLFSFSNNTNGGYPEGSLIADSSGNLFGTTSGGGYADNNGTVFELAAGTHTLTTLAQFAGPGNGANPYGSLVEDSSGNLYGVTNSNGPAYAGTVFEVTPSPFTISATDATGATASKSYYPTIGVSPQITTTTLPAWTVGQAYNQTVLATGGVAPVTFGVSIGNLPAGLTLNSLTGAITGTPTTSSNNAVNFSIAASDRDALTATQSPLATQSYSVVIHAAPSITTTSLANSTVNQPYSKTIAVNNGTAPFTWSVAPNTLPPGLTLNTATGAITGTPNAASGTPYSFTITATDNAGAIASKNYSITINPALNTSPTNLPTASSGLAYSQTITVSGGTTPYSTVSVTAFNGGSTGLTAAFASSSATAGTVTLSGTPTAAGTVSFTVNVTDAAGAMLTTHYTLVVFGIQSVAATPSGVVLTFDAPIDPATTVLYSSPGDTTLGAADITVVGATNGSVRGSLVIDPTNPDMATFVQTSGLLTADTYTVTVTPAVKAVGGAVLGGTFITTLTVTTLTTPVLSVPSFARGPGQAVQLTDSLGNTIGIPVSITNATNVTQASFSLTYDPTLLTIAPSSGMGLDQVGALSLSSLATAAGINTISYSISTEDAHHDVLTVTLTSSQTGGTGLTATSALPLVTITGTVPTTAPYLDKAVLNLSNVEVNTTSATGVSGVDEAAYLGNVSGGGMIGALDASLVSQVGAGAGTGFSAFKDLDPAIIGAVSGGSTVGALDASLVNQAGAGDSIAQIPPMPSGLTLVTGGPDPYLYLSAVQASPGQTVTETLYMDVTDPNGIQLSALDEAIGFNTSALQVSNVRAASDLSAIGSYATVSMTDNASGVLLVGQAFAGSGLPPVLPYGTDVPVLQFDVTLNANLAAGAVTDVTLLQDGTINGRTKFTAISDNEGALTWTPGMAPSNSGNAAIDGSVTVVPQAAPIVPAPVVSAPSRPVVVLPKVVEPVRKVTPIPPTPVNTMATVATDNSLTPLASAETSTPTAETVVAGSPPLVPAAPVQAEVPVIVNPVASVPTLAPEAVPVGSVVQRIVDPGAALSLAALGTNKALPSPTTTTSSARTSTSVLDELYRQLGTLLSTPPANGYNLGVTGDDGIDTFPDLFDPDYILIDLF